MSDLLKLAELCEQATGPDAVLTQQIADYAESVGLLSVGQLIPAYTASTDAALTLAPEGWHVTHSGEGRFMTRGRFAATLETWGIEQADDGSDIHTTPNRRHGVAQTFSLAICAAALRARSA